MFITEIITAIAILVADLVTKNIAHYVIANAPGATVTVIPGFFSFAYTENTGAAWSILSNATWLLTIISFFASVGLIIFLFKTKDKNRFMRMSVTLILAGAVGNLYDRLFLGYVRDMMKFDFINFPIFNVADVAMVVGVIMLIVYVIFIYKEPKKAIETENTDTDVSDFVKEETPSEEGLQESAINETNDTDTKKDGNTNADSQ